MDKYGHNTLYNEFDYLSMLGLELVTGAQGHCQSEIECLWVNVYQNAFRSHNSLTTVAVKARNNVLHRTCRCFGMLCFVVVVVGGWVVGGGGWWCFAKVEGTFNHVDGSFNLFMATTGDVWIIPSFHVSSRIVANISELSLFLSQ